MKAPTRQLIALLAEDGIGRLLAALREQSQTAPQLAKETGASEKTVSHHLELLQTHGIVRWEQAARGSPGRPSRMWHLAAGAEIAAFESACDDFKALLLSKQLDTYREP